MPPILLDVMTPDDARHLGANGAPETPECRGLFAEYMAGHCWAVNTNRSGDFIDTHTRMLYGVFRDCYSFMLTKHRELADARCQIKCSRALEGETTTFNIGEPLSLGVAVKKIDSLRMLTKPGTNYFLEMIDAP